MRSAFELAFRFKSNYYPSTIPRMSLARLSIRRLPILSTGRSVRLYSSGTPQPPAPLPEYQPKSTDDKDVQQSPNLPTTWSTSQNPKKHIFDGPRFEQTDLSLQPNGLSAMAMSAADPIRMVNGRRASCDGGKSGSFR